MSSSAPPRPPSRARRALVGLLVALLLAEGAGHLAIRDGALFGFPLPPFSAVSHARQERWLASLEQDDDTTIGRFDGELGWTWRPSSESADGLFHVNSLGARGTREYSPRPADGTTRIVAFGDSFTFGDEVPDRASYSWIYETNHPDTEVLNFGVSGYGTDQALLRYRSLGRELGAEVVCIGIMLENIGRNVNRYRPLWNPNTGFCAAKPRFVLSENGTLTLLPQPFATKDELRAAVDSNALFDTIREGEYWFDRPDVVTGKWSSLGRMLGGFVAYRERSPARLWSREREEPFQVTLAVLETFHREALADGARLAPILVFPAKEDLAGYIETGERYWAGFLREMEARGLPYIDLIPPLRRREHELQSRPDQGTLYYGGHLSSVGNAVVARELHAWLESNR